MSFTPRAPQVGRGSATGRSSPRHRPRALHRRTHPDDEQSVELALRLRGHSDGVAAAGFARGGFPFARLCRRGMEWLLCCTRTQFTPGTPSFTPSHTVDGVRSACGDGMVVDRCMAGEDSWVEDPRIALGS